MKKRIYPFLIVILIAIVSIFIIFLQSSHKNYNANLNEKIILEEIEESYNKNKLSSDYINKVEIYLDSKSKNSSFYFIRGYLDYINENYKSAIYNFNESKKIVTTSTPSFVKIYTPFLLNKCLVINETSDDLIENCQLVSKYILKENKYKNNTNFIWENISVLISSKDTLPVAIDILKDYLDNANGLTSESKAKILTNLGGLYTFEYNYSKSVYYYFAALDLLKKSPDMNNKDFLIVRLLSNIADINYSLGDYTTALYYYDQAINIPISNKKVEAESKAIAIINKVSSYIELKNYKQAINYSTNINKLLHNLEQDFKDDIEILNYNNLALANIYLGNFELAQEYLNLAFELLQADTHAVTLNKEYFLSYTYAQFYKETGNLDKALKLFSLLLKDISNKGLGLEEPIYKSMRDIYSVKKDFNNYIKYNDLYIKENKFNQDILRSDYIKNSVSMYEREQLKLSEFENKVKLRVLTLIPIILVILLMFKINSIKKLKISNFTNSMTNLYNRNYLDYYIKKNKNKLVNTNISIILLDIDYFKNYNDNYGHIKGDDVIREVANILKLSVRNDDICIRYGGEEMVVILPNTSLDMCENIASTIQESISNSKIEHLYSKVSSILTVSMGIYTKSFSNSDNIYDFIDNADKALYKAKANGRNRFEIFLDK